jgi:nucleotidyltransferase substrate binding protein (TIGR01987 family)
MKKSELDLTNLKNSFNTLEECYSDYIKQSNEKMKNYIKDSCIKRFEYTYETAKKIMNKFLKKEYDKTEKDLSINNIFREMYGLGLVDNFENWVDYREKRNTTSHEYDITKTYPIIDIIPSFIEDTRFLIEKLDSVLAND